MVDLIAGYTKLCSNREKVGISFEIADKKMCLFIRMLLLSESDKLLDRKMSWETTHDTFVQTSSDSIPHNTFERIFRDLNLCSYKQLEKLDNFLKLFSGD